MHAPAHAIDTHTRADTPFASICLAHLSVAPRAGEQAGLRIGDIILEVNGLSTHVTSFGKLLPSDHARPIKLRLQRQIYAAHSVADQSGSKAVIDGGADEGGVTNGGAAGGIEGGGAERGSADGGGPDDGCALDGTVADRIARCLDDQSLLPEGSTDRAKAVILYAGRLASSQLVPLDLDDEEEPRIGIVSICTADESDGELRFAIDFPDAAHPEIVDLSDLHSLLIPFVDMSQGQLSADDLSREALQAELRARDIKFHGSLGKKKLATLLFNELGYARARAQQHAAIASAADKGAVTSDAAEAMVRTLDEEAKDAEQPVEQAMDGSKVPAPVLTQEQLLREDYNSKQISELSTLMGVVTAAKRRVKAVEELLEDASAHGLTTDRFVDTITAAVEHAEVDTQEDDGAAHADAEDIDQLATITVSCAVSAALAKFASPVSVRQSAIEARTQVTECFNARRKPADKLLTFMLADFQHRMSISIVRLAVEGSMKAVVLDELVDKVRSEVRRISGQVRPSGEMGLVPARPVLNVPSLKIAIERGDGAQINLVREGRSTGRSSAARGEGVDPMGLGAPDLPCSLREVALDVNAAAHAWLSGMESTILEEFAANGKPQSSIKTDECKRAVKAAIYDAYAAVALPIPPDHHPNLRGWLHNIYQGNGAPKEARHGSKEEYEEAPDTAAERRKRQKTEAADKRLVQQSFGDNYNLEVFSANAASASAWSYLQETAADTTQPMDTRSLPFTPPAQDPEKAARQAARIAMGRGHVAANGGTSAVGGQDRSQELTLEEVVPLLTREPVVVAFRIDCEDGSELNHFGPYGLSVEARTSLLRAHPGLWPLFVRHVQTVADNEHCFWVTALRSKDIFQAINFSANTNGVTRMPSAAAIAEMTNAAAAGFVWAEWLQGRSVLNREDGAGRVDDGEVDDRNPAQAFEVRMAANFKGSVERKRKAGVQFPEREALKGTSFTSHRFRDPDEKQLLERINRLRPRRHARPVEQKMCSKVSPGLSMDEYLDSSKLKPMPTVAMPIDSRGLAMCLLDDEPTASEDGNEPTAPTSATLYSAKQLMMELYMREAVDEKSISVTEMMAELRVALMDRMRHELAKFHGLDFSSEILIRR